MSKRVAQYCNLKEIKKKIEYRYFILCLDKFFNISICWQGNELKECLNYYHWLLNSCFGETAEFQWFENDIENYFK